MEAKRIEVVKEWPEPKSVPDIQVFLGFAKFYRRFIQGFSRIAAILTSILKTAAPPEKSTSVEDGDSKGGDSVGSVKIAKKSRKSKGQKTSKFQKSAKSKKLLKIGSLPNFNAKNNRPNFLTLKTRSAFNRLRLAFTKARIFWHVDPECHIRIKTDALGYAIGSMLSQLAFGTSPNKVVTKANLG